MLRARQHGNATHQPGKPNLAPSLGAKSFEYPTPPSPSSCPNMAAPPSAFADLPSCSAFRLPPSRSPFADLPLHFCYTSLSPLLPCSKPPHQLLIFLLHLPGSPSLKYSVVTLLLQHVRSSQSPRDVLEVLPRRSTLS